MTRLFVVGAALALAVGCTTVTPPSQVTPLDLWREPESQLVSPGAEILDRREGGPHQTAEGWDSAFVRLLVGSHDAADEVEVFFATELESRGWQPPIDNQAAALGIRASSEPVGSLLAEGRPRVSTRDPRHDRSFAEGPSAGCATVYRIDLVDRPPKPMGS